MKNKIIIGIVIVAVVVAAVWLLRTLASFN